jgi:2-oxoglutarate ferredoxin oxidoreductase subunit alpha
MERELKMTGTGGQGIQVATKILAQTAGLEGKEALHFAVFRGYVRGGLSECTVVLGDEPLVAPPMLRRISAAIVMQGENWAELEPNVKPGGLLLVNSSVVPTQTARTDLAEIRMPFSDMATELGHPMTVSLIALGAFIEATGAVDPAHMADSMRALLPERRHKLIPLNERALAAGAEAMRRHLDARPTAIEPWAFQPRPTAADRLLLEGAEAIGEAAIRAGCRFYASYPIQPNTHLLEYMAENLPKVGGVHINAESELEAVNMVWGAAAAGARAMVSSTGTGMSLMQEAFAEAANAGLPYVIVHMARGQSEYWQATRGGGHGEYRHIVLAPATVQEAVELTGLAFYLADKYRVPAFIQADYTLGHTTEAVHFPTRDESDLHPKDWIATGARGRPIRDLNFTSVTGAASEYGALLEHAGDKYRAIEANEQRWEASNLDDSDFLVVSFGYAARFAKYAVSLARAEGIRAGFFRPISLYPFPAQALDTAARRVRALAVYEMNGGQMLEDVRLAVLGRVPVHFIGGVSQDPSGFGIGPALQPDAILARIREVDEKVRAAREPVLA